MLAAALQAEVAAYVEAFAHEVDEAGHRLVVRNGYHAEREVTTAAGAVPVRQPRVNDKRIDEVTRRAEAVLLGDPAGVGAEVAAGGRGAAAAVPARPVQRGLRAGVGAVPRLDRGPVGGDDHPADRPVARRRRRVREAVAAGQRLRVRVGRRHPPQGPPGAGQGVPAGDDRRPRRRQQGAGRAGRRVPRVHRVVGRPAA